MVGVGCLEHEALTPVTNIPFTIVTKNAPSSGLKGEIEVLLANSTKFTKIAH